VISLTIAAYFWLLWEPSPRYSHKQTTFVIYANTEILNTLSLDRQTIAHAASWQTVMWLGVCVRAGWRRRRTWRAGRGLAVVVAPSRGQDVAVAAAAGADGHAPGVDAESATLSAASADDAASSGSKPVDERLQ